MSPSSTTHIGARPDQHVKTLLSVQLWGVDLQMRCETFETFYVPTKVMWEMVKTLPFNVNMFDQDELLQYLVRFAWDALPQLANNNDWCCPCGKRVKLLTPMFELCYSRDVQDNQHARRAMWRRGRSSNRQQGLQYLACTPT